MRKFWLIIGTLFILIPTIAAAATLRGSETGTVSISKDESLKNAYIAGEQVNVLGSISQDLVAGGKDITIDGKVTDNINAGGGTLRLNGPVGKSVRTAGGTITISNTIGSDLLAAGGTINLTNTSKISDNVYIAGGEIHLDGKIGGNAYITGGEITINNEIAGDVIIREGGKITISENARIGGKLDYTASSRASIASGAVITGETIFHLTKNRSIENNFSGVIASFSIFFAIATLLLLVLVVYLLPKSSRNLLETSLAKPLENLGAGFVYLFMMPIASVIFLVTILGIPIGLALIGLYLISIAIAKIFVPIMLGSLIYKLFKKEKEYRIDWVTIIIGLVASTIIGFIPFVGWVLGFVLLLLLLGALTLNSFKVIQLQQKR